MAYDAPFLAALKRERAAYEQAGKPERVAMVDAEIARVSAIVDGTGPDVDDVVEPPANPKPSKRQTTRKA